VIVTGCYGIEDEAIRKAHPSVLAITGPHQYEQVVKAVHDALPPVHDPKMDLVPPQGLHLTPRHYAYLKISEGCNNRCTFCIIPSIRGDLVSTPAAAILFEAERLFKAGCEGTAGDLAGYVCLWRRSQICRVKVPWPPGEGEVL
jgi:ribosomal protein S12 methylthiotransferase